MDMTTAFFQECHAAYDPYQPTKLLAAALGVSVKTVERWANGKKPVPSTIFEKLPLILEHREAEISSEAKKRVLKLSQLRRTSLNGYRSNLSLTEPDRNAQCDW